MNLRVAVQTQEHTLLCFGHESLPRSVGAISEINRNGFGRGVEVVKGECRVIAVVAAPFTAATFLLNQQLSPLAATPLLGCVTLMSVVCDGVLTPAGAEFSLPAGQFSLADETEIFHTTSKVGLQAYHTQL